MKWPMRQVGRPIDAATSVSSLRVQRNNNTIVSIETLVPWTATKLDVYPPQGFYAFNPSVVFDGTRWLCAIRFANWCTPNGVPHKEHPTFAKSLFAIALLDPDAAWCPRAIADVKEPDGLPRAKSDNVGFHDVRLFRTERMGLCGIAASNHLDAGQGKAHSVEQVVLQLTESPSLPLEFAITGIHPIRGPWSSQHQKNWSPFDGCDEPRFLSSIEDGVLFDINGPLTQRPLKAHTGLRGGSQLVYSAEANAWIGIGHLMRMQQVGRKSYWHRFYALDANTGKLVAMSQPFKIADTAIEFAAGMAVDGDRVVISYGTDDVACWIGETTLQAVLQILDPIVMP